MNNTNWVLSLEDMAAEPTYSEVPKIGLQADDFTTEPLRLSRSLVDRGFGVELPLHLDASTEADDMPNGMIDPDIPQAAYNGQLVSVVSKWPTELKIPVHGNVVAIGMSDEEIKAIAEEGYAVYTNMESYAEAMWLLKAQIGLEGWLAAAKPDIAITHYGGNAKLLSETYMNQSWVEKQGLNAKPFTMLGGNFVAGDRYKTLIKVLDTVIGKNKQVMAKVTSEVYDTARGMYEGKWKDSHWVETQLKKAKVVKHSTAHATMDLSVQCSAIQFMSAVEIKAEKVKVSPISTVRDVVDVAKTLKALMGSKFAVHPQYEDYKYFNVMMTGDEISLHHPEGEMADEIRRVDEDHPALELLGQLYDTFHYVEGALDSTQHNLSIGIGRALKNWLEGSVK